MLLLLSAPNPDNVLALLTAPEVVSTKRLQKKKQTGSRLISTITTLPKDSRLETAVPKASTLEPEHIDPLSAAKCRTFRRSQNKIQIQVRDNAGADPEKNKLDHFERELS
ncbi:hypothetical protein FRX31_033063 [Thalictrum thalictroides]|uniref:Uncharacterized protein n=1 Tax=Thalictrum thalictroides TaxID=46969 RepID=A0A7J6UZ65_THATH|nr:hypothetical protein FRX31_033063 [Thalictrum thalictroides]